MEIPAQIPQERLIDFSKEHLYYEIDMLLHTSRILMERRHEDYYLFSVLLESFVVHACNLLDFFYKPQIKEDDARAVHYVSDVKAWHARLAPFYVHFKNFHSKRNKEVMHLSYMRLDIKEEQKAWGVRKVAKEILNIVALFLEMADPQRVHPRLYKFARKR